MTTDGGLTKGFFSSRLRFGNWEVSTRAIVGCLSKPRRISSTSKRVECASGSVGLKSQELVGQHFVNLYFGGNFLKAVSGQNRYNWNRVQWVAASACASFPSFVPLEFFITKAHFSTCRMRSSRRESAVTTATCSTIELDGLIMTCTIT